MLLSIVLRRPIGDGPGDDIAFDRSVISESLRESLVERAALMRRACFSSSSPQRPRKESFGSGRALRRPSVAERRILAPPAADAPRTRAI